MITFTPDPAYAEFAAGQQAIRDAWLADPANAATVGQATPASYQLTRRLDEHDRLHNPTSPDYQAPVTA